MTYEETFLQYADDKGDVDADVATQFLLEHCTDIDTICEDGFDYSESLNAQALLHWMGY